jgi:ribosomal protein L16 Arg81 hydroxylase
MLNALLNSYVVAPSDFRMVSSGNGIPDQEYTESPRGRDRVLVPQKIIRLCQGGATFIIDGIERYVASIRDTVAELADELGEHVQANLYCSWPGVKGFALHYDWHEALMIQIEGSKAWRVFEPTIESPIEPCRKHLTRPTQPPYCRVTLRRGDCLYIPRGHWHDAVAEEEPSVHVTISIPCRTGLAFIAWLADQLKDSVTWRQNAPLMLACVDISYQDRWRAHATALVDALSEALRDASIAERYLDYVRGSRRPATPFMFPHRGAEWLGVGVRRA